VCKTSHANGVLHGLGAAIGEKDLRRPVKGVIEYQLSRAVSLDW
jgi:hypothetical protein